MPIFRKNQDYFFEERPQSWEAQVKEFIWELIKVVIISLSIIIPVRYFLIQPFYVKGASMEPNFYDHEYLIIDEISYGIKIPFSGKIIPFDEPKRGEIVVFKYPQDPSQYFIKRIIGLPHEKIEIKGGKIYIYNQENPQRMVLNEEAYLKPTTKTPGSGLVILGKDEYYVLGDNRSSSLDSRTFGPVPRTFIIGRALLRGWPFDKFRLFTKPEYDF